MYNLMVSLRSYILSSKIDFNIHEIKVYLFGRKKFYVESEHSTFRSILSKSNMRFPTDFNVKFKVQLIGQ